MKCSYPDSLIALAASFAAASLAVEKKYDAVVAGNKGKRLTFPKFNLKHKRIGIKFDDISAGKYFALINKTQRHSVVGMKLVKMG